MMKTPNQLIQSFEDRRNGIRKLQLATHYDADYAEQYYDGMIDGAQDTPDNYRLYGTSDRQFEPYRAGFKLFNNRLRARRTFTPCQAPGLDRPDIFTNLPDTAHCDRCNRLVDVDQVHHACKSLFLWE